jgi:UDP-glucose 4-epimerase
MSVLITGGSGFVGLCLAEAVLGRGEDAVLLDAQAVPESARPALASHPGSFHEAVGDVRDAALLDRVFGDHGVDRVFQGAAVTGAYARERNDPASILDVNVMGTLAVLEAARRHGVARFLYPSSVAVYGESNYRYPSMDEETTPPVPAGLYGITKYTGERLSLRFADLWGIDVVCARIGVVFGPWERDTGFRDTLSPHRQTTSHATAGAEVVLPPRPYLRDWIYSRDLADALATLLFAAAPSHQVYNASSGTASDVVVPWCERLAVHLAGFSWRLAGSPEEANIEFHDPLDRNPQSMARLYQDIGWRASFTLDAAFDDTLEWLERTPGY